VTDEIDDAALVAELWREVRPAQLALLHQLVADVATASGGGSPEPDPEVWDRIRDASHRLAGTLGSFGQQAAGEAAVAIEELLGGSVRAEEVPLDRLRALTVALHEALPHSAAECLSR
jgi:chemotaxis protein histidine kinase CheA